MTAAIGLTIMQWQDATQAYDEAVGVRLGLNMAERHCIGLLYGGPQSAGAIAIATGLTPAAVTAAGVSPVAVATAPADCGPP